MSSKSSNPSNTTTTTELPTWAQPYAQQLLQRSSDLSNTTIPQYSGQLTAGLSDAQQGGIANTNAAASGAQSNADAATQYYQQLMGGSGYSASNPYTGDVTASNAAAAFADPSNNPYLKSVVDASNKQITDAYSNVTAPTTLAQFRNAGAFGGSAQQQYTGTQEKQLADSLSANTSGMYNSAYNTAAQVAAQNAAQANQVALANQSVGTNAGLSTNNLNSQNYYSNISSILSALSGATQANANAGTQAGNQITAGGVQQQNSQDALNAAYQQWYNQVNQPYQQLSTLSSGLSGALGSGVGTSISQTNAGSGNTLASLLGIGSLGLGAYNAFK
jgi:hypothetical protein